MSAFEAPEIPASVFDELDLMKRAVGLLAGRIAGAQTEFLDEIRANVRRLESVCLALSTWKTVSRDTAECATDPVDLHRIAESVVTSVRNDAAASGVRLVYRTSREDAWCRGNGEQLRVALESLVRNAVKFGANGRVTLSVDSSPGRVGFVVEDSGPGMAPSELPSLVRPFRQGEAGDTRTHGGLGLGLALADRIAGLHGGRLSVDNRNAGGSRFRFELDRVAAPAYGPLRRAA